MEKKKFFHKKKGAEARVGKECDSNERSPNSFDEDITNIVVDKDKEGQNKVYTRDTPKYTTSDDESDSSDDDENLSLLFKGLSFEQIEKINELVKAINKNDELLESQEDLLIRQNENFVKLKEDLAHEVEKCKNLTKDSIYGLKIEDVYLHAKIKELNVAHASTSIIEHVSI